MDRRKIIISLNYLSCHRLLKDGVTFKQGKINSLKELTGEFDIVINCTGLGARKLCNDKRLVSIRGQVLKVCYHIFAFVINSVYRHDLDIFFAFHLSTGKGTMDESFLLR